MSMISKMDFDELVKNTTHYLTEHSARLSRIEKQLQELNDRLTHIESRKKPGPKPKAKTA